MTQKTYILRANSPAALAEEYIIKSIWNKTYPAGSFLPAERDLADKIGVTRTTLREVLQRLSREGWLHIQHGKPTQVNNIWETGGPGVIERLMKLDKQSAPYLLIDLLSLRTQMSAFYIKAAVELNQKAAAEIFDKLDSLEETPESYTQFDYFLFREFTVVANKPGYSLIYNSFKGVYDQVGPIFWRIPEAREITLNFYKALREICETGESEKVATCIARHREESQAIWNELLAKLPPDFSFIN